MQAGPVRSDDPELEVCPCVVPVRVCLFVLQHTLLCAMSSLRSNLGSDISIYFGLVSAPGRFVLEILDQLFHLLLVS